MAVVGSPVALAEAASNAPGFGPIASLEAALGEAKEAGVGRSKEGN